MGFGTPFREAFREYKIQSGAIDAVLKDVNHNESESMMTVIRRLYRRLMNVLRPSQKVMMMMLYPRLNVMKRIY